MVKTSAYDFLRENRDLQGLAYLVASGSHGYGTNVATSDLDLRGFLIEDERYLLGLHTFEQFEEKETDTVIFGAQKFIRLCAQGNPNVLELLGVEEAEIVICTEAGKMVRSHAELFLSKRIEQTFGNYANAQLKRLQNALVRNEESHAVREQHILETLQKQMSNIESKYAIMGPDGLKLRMENTEIVMDAELSGYPLRDFIGIYGELQGTMRTYEKLGKADQPKDLPRLYKHAMHLVRMLVTGRDILADKGIITKRVAEHDLLIAIRKGELSFAEIFDRVAVLQVEFEQAARETNLPEQVDMQRVEDLLISLYKGA